MMHLLHSFPPCILIPEGFLACWHFPIYHPHCLNSTGTHAHLMLMGMLVLKLSEVRHSVDAYLPCREKLLCDWTEKTYKDNNKDNNIRLPQKLSSTNTAAWPIVTCRYLNISSAEKPFFSCYMANYICNPPSCKCSWLLKRMGDSTHWLFYSMFHPKHTND